MIIFADIDETKNGQEMIVIFILKKENKI